MPQEARSICLRAGTDEALSPLRRAGIDATALRELLGDRRSHDDWTAFSGVVELSDEYGRRTEMAVHVPPSARDGRIGAMVVLHGAGGNGEQMLPHFEALGDRLGMAVVCPTAQLPPSAPNRLDFAGIFGKRFDMPCWDLQGSDFPLAAVRWARTELGVDPDRCVITGLSMGGLATWNLSMKFRHFFAAAVPINGALSMWESFGTDRRTRALLPNTLPLPLFVMHGGRDERIVPRFDRESVATLRELGHQDLEYVEVPDGEHDLQSLRIEQGTPLFHRLEKWLGGRRRTGWPAEIRHRAIDDDHGRAYWAAIGGITPPEIAELHARRVSRDRIDVEVTGATHVTVHLTSDWFTRDDNVTVSVNGDLTEVRFTPDVETVVKTFREYADPALAAEHVVTLAVP